MAGSPRYAAQVTIRHVEQELARARAEHNDIEVVALEADLLQWKLFFYTLMDGA